MARQEPAHTPELDLETGVGKDLSLPVVDLESSVALACSMLDLAVPSEFGSDLLVSPMSEGAADVSTLGDAVVGDDATASVFNRPGLPMMPVI